MSRPISRLLLSTPSNLEVIIDLSIAIDVPRRKWIRKLV
jgi:hypothetical protein